MTRLTHLVTSFDFHAVNTDTRQLITVVTSPTENTMQGSTEAYRGDPPWPGRQRMLCSR